MLNICVVTKDIVGPIRNGGIGTAYANLCSLLAKEGHRVTILYTLGDYTESQPSAKSGKYYAKLGIEFIALPPFEIPIQGDREAAYSFRVYQWLKPRAFDVVHFHELGGLAYYSLLAKGQNLAFSTTELWVGTHGPTFWHFHFNKEFPASVTDLCVDHMERMSVELADRVISPSQFMVDWMKQHQWKLPSNVRVIQNVFHLYRKRKHRPIYLAGPTELVFFGRLENRKGLELFCDAVSRILPLLEEKSIKVTFLGKAAVQSGFDSLSYLSSRSRHWPVESRHCGNLNTKEALDFLYQKNVLAVVPSLSENSPYAVLECLALGIPCIASDVGGIGELIHPEDRERCLFSPNVEQLAERITSILEAPARSFKPGRLKQSPEVTHSLWLEAHDEIKKRKRSKSQPVHKSLGSSPPLSICLIHRNRPQLLKRCLASIEKQKNVNYELILVDDGSDAPEALELLSQLELELSAKKALLLRQSRSYPGAARNLAAQKAKGEYLLFMDDDNIAEPTEAECLLKAARASQSDILTCASFVFDEEETTFTTKPDKRLTQIHLFLGGALSPGFYSNVFGDTNSLIKRDVFLALGGFSEDYGVGYEDWEFFAKAALRGYKIQTVPEPLFWYRRNQTGVNSRTDRFASRLRALRPYLEVAPFPLGPALLLAGSLADTLAAGANSPEPELETDVTNYSRADALFEDPESLVLQRLDEGTGFSSVGVENIDWVDYDPILRFKSTNTDPILHLPQVDVPEDHVLVVQAHLRLSNPCDVEMFFTTDEGPEYSETRRLRQRMQPGEHQVTFRFPRDAKGRLRLDPGTYLGWYEIERIEIRAVSFEQERFFRLPNRRFPGCNPVR